MSVHNDQALWEFSCLHVINKTGNWVTCPKCDGLLLSIENNDGVARRVYCDWCVPHPDYREPFDQRDGYVSPAKAVAYAFWMESRRRRSLQEVVQEMLSIHFAEASNKIANELLPTLAVDMEPIAKLLSVEFEETDDDDQRTD